MTQGAPRRKLEQEKLHNVREQFTEEEKEEKKEKLGEKVKKNTTKGKNKP